MTTPIGLNEDRRLRWVPSATALDIATRALESQPDADMAVVPMYQPGKIYGIWQVGQRVETVEAGFEDVLLAVNSHTPSGAIPSLITVRDTAFQRASEALREHGKGTTSYAVVSRDGSCAVFEEVLSDRG
jgi:hypothetical protein